MSDYDDEVSGYDREALECDRGVCYLGANHVGDCKPGPGRLPQGSGVDDA